MFSLATLATILVALPTAILAQTVPCSGTVTNSGNRKIAIVIDSSGSNVWTDPSNLRIAAGESIVSNLASTDRVAVIDFDDVASVVSPLGPPSAASFASIDSSGGTYIAGGVELAITELTKDPTNPTTGVSGIIVLTDGEDASVSDLVTQINKAASLGIRVSFGFLNPSSTGSQDPDILAAIIASNGIYATIDDASAQANFVSLVLSHGLVNNDSTSASGHTLLLPGLAVTGNISAATSPSTFQYDALAAEELNITIQAISVGQSFDVTLKKKGGADIKSASTDASGMGTIVYTVGSTAEQLELDVSTKNQTSGLFSIALSSSVNRTINVCGSNNVTNPNSTATPTSTNLPAFTGAASLVRGVMAAAVFPVLFAIAL